MAAKNIDPLADGIDAVSIGGGAQDWNFSCGVCHVGGGQMEYDRNRNPVTASSPAGDYFQFQYASVANPDPGGDPLDLWDANNDGTANDTTGISAGIMVTADKKAETDCMMCHSGRIKVGNVMYKTMGCNADGVFDPTDPTASSDDFGPMNDKNCDGVQDNPMFDMVSAKTVTSLDAVPGQDDALGQYDMYNRNHALKRARLDLAASMGLGALGVGSDGVSPAGLSLVTADGTTAAGLEGINWGTDAPVIVATDLKGTPDPQNCTICHSRDDDTLGLPGMIQMKTGFGNYIAFDAPGNFDSSKDGSVSDNWDFELGCKPGMGKRATSVGEGPHQKWGISGVADMFGLYQFNTSTDGNPNAAGVMPGQYITGDELMMPNPMYDSSLQPGDEGYMPPEYEFVPSGIQPTKDIPDGDVHNLADVTLGGETRKMACNDCHFMFGKDGAADLTRGYISDGTDGFDAGSYVSDAGTFRKVNYPATEIHSMDHQFATGNSSPDTNGMDYLDETVSCESCHTTLTHPKLDTTLNADGIAGGLTPPVPLHNGMPQLHLDRIGCVTCHIPEVYAAPGKKKYRDWSVGFFKNNYYRNMLDWNYDLVTGGYRPTQPSHAWMTQNGETKIYPFFPSHDPMWIDHVHDSQTELGSELGSQTTCGDTQIRCADTQACIDYTDADGNSLALEDQVCVGVDPVAVSVADHSQMKNRVMSRAGEYMEDAYIAGDHDNYIRRNEGYVAPLFDGFSLADSQVIDTKADLDYMIETAFANIEEGENAGYLQMYQKNFDLTHGVVPAEWALGGSERGGCVSCHSSAKPMMVDMDNGVAENNYMVPNPSYSPLSYGFFEGRNQPHYYAGQKMQTDPNKAWMMGLGIGGVDYAKNWFSAFAEYDCTAMCATDATQQVMIAKMGGVVDGACVDSVCQGGLANGQACTDNAQCVGSEGDFDALKEADGRFFNPMTGAVLDMNAACDTSATMFQTIGQCVSMMQSGFDTILGLPDGSAAMMGMNDGISGLQGFVVKEGHQMGTVGCNPMGGTIGSPVLQGMGGNVNKCMPDYTDAAVASDADVRINATMAATAMMVDMGMAADTTVAEGMLIGMTTQMGTCSVTTTTSCVDDVDCPATETCVGYVAGDAANGAIGYIMSEVNGTCGVDEVLGTCDAGTVTDCTADTDCTDGGVCVGYEAAIADVCDGGFRDGKNCLTSADCSGAETDPVEVARNPMGRINSRDQVRKAYKLDLMQSSGGNAGMPLDTDHLRIKWPMGGTQNPSNPTHENKWDQAQICIDPQNSPNPFDPIEVPCVEGGLIQTVVKANQYLGYAEQNLALLMSPQQAGETSTDFVVAANFSGLPSSDVNYTATFATESTDQNGKTTVLSACYANVMPAEGDNVTPITKVDKTCTYDWDFGTGILQGGSTDVYQVVSFAAAGDYTATLTMCMEDDALTAEDESTICDTQQVTVTVGEVEVPDFSGTIAVNDLGDGTCTVQASAIGNAAKAYIYWGDRTNSAVTPAELTAGVTDTCGAVVRVKVYDADHNVTNLTFN